MRFIGHRGRLPLTVRIRLGGARDDHARGSSPCSAAVGADVTEELPPSDGRLGVDERVDGALEDPALPLGTSRGIGAAEDGLDGADAQDGERGEGGHGGGEEAGCVGCCEVIQSLDDEAGHGGLLLYPTGRRTSTLARNSPRGAQICAPESSVTLVGPTDVVHAGKGPTWIQGPPIAGAFPWWFMPRSARSHAPVQRPGGCSGSARVDGVDGWSGTSDCQGLGCRELKIIASEMVGEGPMLLAIQLLWGRSDVTGDHPWLVPPTPHAKPQVPLRTEPNQRARKLMIVLRP